MFDFVSYVRDMGVEVRILPAGKGALMRLELRDPETGFFGAHEITDWEAKGCGNIDTYTGQVLDRMAAKIGSRKAQQYANRLGDRQRQEREAFFRGA